MLRISILTVTLLMAQPGTGSTAIQPAGEPAVDRPTGGLDPVPLVAEPLGLQMHVPAEAVVTTQVVDGRLTYLLRDAGAVPTWSMRIGALVSTLLEPSAAAVVSEQIKAVKATGRAFRIIADEPVRYGAADGRLLYLQVTNNDNDQKQAINGWLILATSARTFLVFSVATTADHFAKLRPVFDASFATISLRSAEEVLKRRLARLERGRAIIDTFTPEKLRSVVDERQWYRIYQPAASGQRANEKEFGYLTMQCIEAMRGELTSERSPESFSAMEAERGLMVLIEARAIINAQNNHYLDVQGRYWMVWDRSKEAWSLRRTERQGEASRTTAETGVRTFGTLNVIHSSAERFTREPKEWSIPDKAYLCQPEVFMLGSLLPRDGSISGVLAFFCYDTRLQRLPLRIDRWQPASDGSGNWVLTTQPALDAASVTHIFDSAGNRLKRIDADGKVTQRIDPNELRRLWRAKGLLPR